MMNKKEIQKVLEINDELTQLKQKVRELTEMNEKLKKRIEEFDLFIDAMNKQSDNWDKLCDCSCENGEHDEDCMVIKIRLDENNLYK